MSWGCRSGLVGLLLGLLGGLPASCPAQPALTVEALAPIDASVADEIAAGRIPGAVVLVGQGERVVYTKAFGHRAVVPAAEAMTLDTIFDLASLTKVVATTPAILELAERGALSLDAPAARYWPGFGSHGKQTITIRQLLAHTSGLPAGIDLRGAADATVVRRRLAAVVPETPPGRDPLYSDVNFAVLGEIVRRVSGQPLDAYAARRIFRPLGMTDTGFAPPPGKRARIAPTSWNGGHSPDGVHRGDVQDPLAARLGGVAGNAGVFATAADLAAFARALLAGGAPILSAASLRQMGSLQTPPAAPPRGLGWRLEAPLAANRAALPPVATLSHLGYTGTGMWLDRISGTYVVVLSNRVHPDGRGDAGPLRAKVVAAVADALGPLPAAAITTALPDAAARVAAYVPMPVTAPLRTGIDVLEVAAFAPLRGLRVGLLTHRAGVDGAGRRTVDVLAAAPGVALKAIFSPEHGLGGDREGRIVNGSDPRTGLPIYSLYGETRRPTPAMLDGLDAVVVDLQDAGVRFYTYASTVGYLLEAAAERKIKVFVLDRPNPLGAATVQGPPLDPGRRSFTAYWPLPVRHGMTLGELARLFAGEAKLAVDLTVIPMQGYRREDWYDDSGLPWIPPSPNLLDLTAATLYPGVGMIEGGEVSVGRGTAGPFQVVGAPWLDGRGLAMDLAAAGLAGLSVAPTEFVPVTGPWAGQHCHGVRLTVNDRNALDTPALGVALAATLQRRHPRQFSLDRIVASVGSQATVDAIRAGRPVGEIVAGWRQSLDDFLGVRQRYLLY